MKNIFSASLILLFFLASCSTPSEKAKKESSTVVTPEVKNIDPKKQSLNEYTKISFTNGTSVNALAGSKEFTITKGKVHTGTVSFWHGLSTNNIHLFKYF